MTPPVIPMTTGIKITAAINANIKASPLVIKFLFVLPQQSKFHFFGTGNPVCKSTFQKGLRDGSVHCRTEKLFIKRKVGISSDPYPIYLISLVKRDTLLFQWHNLPLFFLPP
jgi:hypothetical protein